MKKRNLQAKRNFMDKIIQLYDMIKCRHGLMIVGPADSGKTTTYNVLKEAITKVAIEAAKTTQESTTPKEKEVQTYVINPKSITLP